MTERKFDVLKMSGVPSKADADRQRTDRELLKLAAKAEGLTLAEHHMSTGYPWCNELRRPWNPLEDDGDALRLATRCLMDVVIGITYVTADALLAVPPVSVTEVFTDGDQRLPMTRRAIVRAAAAMAEGGGHG